VGAKLHGSEDHGGVIGQSKVEVLGPPLPTKSCHLQSPRVLVCDAEMSAQRFSAIPRQEMIARYQAARCMLNRWALWLGSIPHKGGKGPAQPAPASSLASPPRVQPPPPILDPGCQPVRPQLCSQTTGMFHSHDPRWSCTHSLGGKADLQNTTKAGPPGSISSREAGFLAAT
jgi:hypothetical protein